jgi:hypothetical protein
VHALYTGLAVWNLLALLGLGVLGVVREIRGTPSVETFQVCALFAAVFCCLVHTLLIAHFVGSMKWIQQSGPTAGVEDTKPLRTAWIRGRMFPVVMTAMLVAVAIGILAGAAARGAVAAWTWLALTAASLPLNAWALRLARVEILRQGRRVREMRERMEARVGAGLVRDADAASLLPESGRAGGKVLLFLAVNVWVLYGYARFVLRDPHEPLWPYAVASAVLALVGWRLLRRVPDPLS